MLSQSQIESYDRDGFLCPLRVLSPADLSRFQAGFRGSISENETKAE